MKYLKKCLFVIMVMAFCLFINVSAEESGDIVCDSILGGEFTLIYNSMGGNSIPVSSVPIALPPERYDDLVEPKRDGYTFDGWYYDVELTQKVDGTSEGDIQPDPIINDCGRISGYNDVTIYAKWIKDVNESCVSIDGGSFNLIYDSMGGNSIPTSSVAVAIPIENSKDLVVPEKEGYTFDGWYYDKELTKKVDGTKEGNIESTPIISDCGGISGYEDVTIYAKWISNEANPSTNINSNITFICILLFCSIIALVAVYRINYFRKIEK